MSQTLSVWYTDTIVFFSQFTQTRGSKTPPPSKLPEKENHAMNAALNVRSSHTEELECNAWDATLCSGKTKERVNH